MQQGHKADSKELPVSASVESGEEKAAEAKATDDGDMPIEDSGEDLHDFFEFPAAADGGEQSSDETGSAGEADAGNTLDKGRAGGAKDGCVHGAMRFEGKCVDKDRVQQILDRRGREAINKVQKATRPEQTADAAHYLLEQQIAQVDKTEDDLDEIIEQLEKERDAKKEKMAEEKEERP